MVLAHQSDGCISFFLFFFTHCSDIIFNINNSSFIREEENIGALDLIRLDVNKARLKLWLSSVLLFV